MEDVGFIWKSVPLCLAGALEFLPHTGIEGEKGKKNISQTQIRTQKMSHNAPKHVFT